MNIFFRVDSGSIIGSGHIMRCLCLARYLNKHENIDHENIYFICAEHIDNIMDIIPYNIYKFDVNTVITTNTDSWLGNSVLYDAGKTIGLLRKHNNSILIVDHYAIGKVWENYVKPYTDKIIVIDDLHNRMHKCDVLIDQYNIDKGDVYKDNLLVPSNCKTLLGYRYVMLNPVFNRPVRYRDGILRVHVFFGSSDHINMTETLLKEIVDQGIWYYIFDIVIGPINKNYHKIKQKYGKYRNIKIHHNVKPLVMADLLWRADIAIGCTATSSVERCAQGLRTLVINTAENQMENARNLNRYGVIEYIGTYQTKDVAVKTLNRLTYYTYKGRRDHKFIRRRCHEIVDGKGLKRISKIILDL